MTEDDNKKTTKSFSLKIKNAMKIKRIAYETNKKESEIIDKLIEEYQYGNN